MSRIVFGLVLLLGLAPALWALDEAKDKAKEEKPASPADQYKALLAEAKKAPRSQQQLAPKFLDLAQKNPKDPVAVDALCWVVTNSPFGTEAAKAMDILLKDHADSEKLGPVCARLAMFGVPSAEKFLRGVLDKSPNHKIQGQACLGLGQILKNKSERPGADKKVAREAEELLDRVVQKYGDVAKLADTAKTDLFELRNLAIGKVAPEIEGEDGDGKKFKLSDYKGKVVVLDFWANW